MNTFKPETLAIIEGAVPQRDPATAVDVWKASKGLSHQTVKMALKELVQRGRVLRTSEAFRGSKLQFRYRYRRAV